MITTLIKMGKNFLNRDVPCTQFEGDTFETIISKIVKYDRLLFVKVSLE